MADRDWLAELEHLPRRADERTVYRPGRAV
jgi:hypothetical protein